MQLVQRVVCFTALFVCSHKQHCKGVVKCPILQLAVAIPVDWLYYFLPKKKKTLRLIRCHISNFFPSYFSIKIIDSIKILKEIDSMLFKGLRNKVMANKRCILCTKELVDKVDEILSEKVIVRDKPSYYTLQRLFDAKQVNLSAITMLEDVNYVLTHMIDDTRQPDLIRYNNLVEAKLSEYERLLDKQIEYDYCQIMFKIQEYTDELLRYGEACYELSEDVHYKISQLIVNDNSILSKCSRTTLLSFNSLMGDEHKYLKDRYCKYVIKGNEALHMLVDLLKKEEA